MLMRLCLFCASLLIVPAYSACALEGENEAEVVPAGESVTFIVKTMTCSGCENTISNQLKAMKGVKDAKASHIQKTVNVIFDKTVITKEEIKKKIELLGHKVEN